jgi:hypothetical protein
MGLSKRLRMAGAWGTAIFFVGIGLWTGVFPQILRMMPANY